MHFISLPQQKLGEISAVLAGNTGDQSFFHLSTVSQSRPLKGTVLGSYLPIPPLCATLDRAARRIQTAH